MVYRKVKQYCREHRMSVSAFEKMCGIGNGAVARWDEGGSHPSIATLFKMQQVTGLSIQYWLSEEEVK